MQHRGQRLGTLTNQSEWYFIRLPGTIRFLKALLQSPYPSGFALPRPAFNISFSMNAFKKPLALQMLCVTSKNQRMTLLFYNKARRVRHGYPLGLLAKIFIDLADIYFLLV